MNKITTLAAISMFAVIMVMGAIAPAIASPSGGDGEKHNPKVAICHFDYNEMVWESDKMVNAHALVSHQDHGDKLVPSEITAEACEAQSLLPPKV
jgi:hypothetical protein